MRILLLITLLVTSFISHAQLITLKEGMKINSSVKVRRDVYAINAKSDLAAGTTSNQIPILEISGNDIVVDFNNALLKGSNEKQLPDEFYGLAIMVKGGKNITIRNLSIRGYKVALMAVDVEGLVIENCDLSYNYRKHLNSTQEKEDISDWMSFHQNEKDEWLRYGAAIYLRNCNRATIQNNIVTGGQCALMLTDCNDGRVLSNNFSFNSAIGIGMYRSSRNQVMFNRLDWNVRGHSEGVYNRGQDSAAILVFEQCNNNMFIYNSATHSGDGFFLWAGQSTMDSGQGGCNDNLLVMNDFSHAPTNGIEVTFSRNTIISNRLEECDHGIWGGYSYNTDIQRNYFARNRIAIAIEHGQENNIFGNTFTGNRESIRLWARKQQPADWGYAQKRDTRSMKYRVNSNLFSRDSIIYNIVNTTSVVLKGNEKKEFRVTYKLDSVSAAGIDSSEENLRLDLIAHQNQIGLGGFAPDRNMIPELKHPRGRKQIRITEWGPYDFRSPLVWRSNPVDTSGLLKFELIGPEGSWRLVDSKGVEGISKSSGTLPDSITARKRAGYNGEVLIELEYKGDTVTDQFGGVIAAGQPVRFMYRDSRVIMKWDTRWYSWDSVTNPVKDPQNWKKLVSRGEVLRETGKPLDYAWWGGISVAGSKVQQFITAAETSVSVSPGEYELGVTWDDAVRVYFDGKLIINEWNPSLYKFDESPHKKQRLKLGGTHKLRVEHVELGGFATLSVKLKKV
ncbi:MAG TPA: right-handed parallel beta-helix repeat-containing protein [Chitinophagaceae bacterium]